MNEIVINNFRRIKPTMLLLPLCIIILVIIFLYWQDALNVDSYVQIQKDYFYFLNSKLSQFHSFEYNLTQFGDGLVFLALLSILIVYTPKVWESLFSALLVSVILSSSLKEIFSVPRPATIFDNDSFTIIGKTLTGYASLPSGHSITTFTILSVLLFLFMPKKAISKVLWTILIIIVGLIIISTRVGVGAHHPFDTVIGSLIGVFSGIAGILISRKYKIWNWIENKKYYPVFIILFVGSIVVLILKIMTVPLTVFYLAIISLIISLYVVTKIYLKK
ncbi:phosphatase PAP2 family protein [Weeksellaceae bacterium TAE3-ERU29]|nr:phosphatase PAP2 family protein [Weeksellaceae bacterium TAE3-ERU29]